MLFLWKRRKSQQKHLLILLDCNFSENWVDYLHKNPDISVSIQGSTGMLEKAKYCQLGGFFTHNFLKLMEKKSKENVLIPSNQQLCFQGSLLQIKKYTNLLIYYKTWSVLENNLKYVFQVQKGEECCY